MSRSRTLNLVTMLALAVLGCATERPTRGVDVAKLPATPISVVPVLESSDWTPASGEWESVQTIHFDSSFSLGVSTDWDIALRCTFDAARQSSGLLALENSGSVWSEFLGALPPSKSVICNWDGCDTPINRLTSQLKAASRFLTHSGAFRIRGQNARDFHGRLVHYSPDYHFVTVRVEDILAPPGFGVADGSLFIFSTYRDPSNRTFHDSIVTLDLTGARRSSVGVPLMSKARAFDGSGFWMSGSRLWRVDTLGQVTASLPPLPQTAIAMAWDDSLLWWVSYGFSFFPPLPVHAIDIDASIALDSLVTESRFTIAPRLIFAMTVDSAGPIVIDATLGNGRAATIHRYTRSGEIRDSIMGPVTGIDAAAWKGGYLWTLHHGPPEAWTDATLLTRFTLE